MVDLMARKPKKATLDDLHAVLLEIRDFVSPKTELSPLIRESIIPWQPAVGDTVEVIKTGECGTLAYHREGMGWSIDLLSDRRAYFGQSELRPTQIEPGDVVVVGKGTSGAWLGRVTSARVCDCWVAGISAGAILCSRDRLTLLLKGNSDAWREK